MLPVANPVNSATVAGFSFEYSRHVMRPRFVSNTTVGPVASGPVDRPAEPADDPAAGLLRAACTRPPCATAPALNKPTPQTNTAQRNMEATMPPCIPNLADPLTR
ncbi:hypothetical protein GCM10022270_00920 [Terriglobus aquaticus]